VAAGLKAGRTGAQASQGRARSSGSLAAELGLSVEPIGTDACAFSMGSKRMTYGIFVVKLGLTFTPV